MSEIRKIKKVIRSTPTIEGAGVHLHRVFGYPQLSEFDPFLLFDDFHSDREKEYYKGFPWHPHRGIETITYVLHGSVEHQDSMGNKGVIGEGDLQWMTAGSGIIHQEMPKGDAEKHLWGFQLWSNLPAEHKMMDPRYQEIKASEIPVVDLEDGTQIRVICGIVKGVEGPVQGVVSEPEYLDVTVPKGVCFERAFPEGHTVFVYILDGRGYFTDEEDPFGYDSVGRGIYDIHRECVLDSDSVVLYEKGQKVQIRSVSNKVRFLLISGKPIGEPISWYGPIVMNTREELRVAFEEYQKGTFLKHKE